MKKAYSIYIYLVLILWSSCFGLIYILPYFKNLFNFDSLIILLFPICLVFLVFVWFHTRKIYLNIGGNYFYWCFIFLLFASLIYSSAVYSQGLFGTFKPFAYFLIPLFSVFVYFQFPPKFRKLDVLLLAIKIVSIIDSILAILSFVLIYTANINILNIPYSIRNGTPRLGIGTGIVLVSLFISFVSILQKKKIQLIDFANLLFGLVQVIVVNKGRSAIFYLAITFLFGALLFLKLWPRIIVFSLLVIAILLLSPTFSAFSNAVEVYFYGDAGIMVRFQAIEFYMNQFYHHPLIGMGFISTNGPYWYLAQGYDGLFYYDDVGIVGFMNRFGCVGLLLISYLIFKCAKTSLGNHSISGYVEKTFLFYIVVSLINLSFLDVERLVYLFFLFAINDYSLREKGNATCREHIYRRSQSFSS